MYILLDLLVIVGMSVAIARACVAYCRDIGIPFAWAMRVTGDKYDGDVLEITKSVKILGGTLGAAWVWCLHVCVRHRV